MNLFVYNANRGRVIFGRGSLRQLSGEAERLSAKRLLLICAPSQADPAAIIVSELGDRLVGIFPRPAMHTPIEVTEEALRLLRSSGADGIVAVGGGSAIGLAKALALRTDLPQIVIPTTYAGSEVTPVIGETKDGAKSTQTTLKVLPEVVIYDPNLSATLPKAISVTSGFNAMAHAVEALYARERNPIISLLAVEGCRALFEALPAIATNPGDIEARDSALYGAWLCGVCLGSVGMALHHKLCHTLGGTFGLAHAPTHTVILPHALAYNRPAARPQLDMLVPLLGENPARRLFDLAASLDAPQSLRELGMPEAGIGPAAIIAANNPYWNPRQLDEASLHDLLDRAWHGLAPTE